VFTKPETLSTMLTLPATNLSEGAAMGIFKDSVDNTVCWLHGGLWGVAASFCPELGLGFARAGLEREAIGTGFNDFFIPAVRAVRACKQ
jgi:hypothetical protein